MPLDLSVAFATRPRVGEDASGDCPILRREAEGILFGVIDALGHGPRAEVAAVAGAAFLARVRLDTPMGEIMWGLHEALRGSRGAAATILLFREGELTGSAVGNVALRAHGTPIPLLPVPGILGERFAVARVFRKSLARGDRQVIFSDGIAWPGMRLQELETMDAPTTADHLMQTLGQEHDDATVLVADVIDISRLGATR